MLVPLYGFLAGDTLGLIVLVHADDRVREIAAKLVQAALPRVAPPAGEVCVMWRGKSLPLDATIAELGLEPLDRIDVGRIDVEVAR
jgi:toluene-4-monooxygenase system protein B